GEELYDRLLRQRQPLARALQLALVRAAGGVREPGRPAISVATPALFGPLAGELELELPEAGELEVRKGKTARLPPEPVRLVGRAGPVGRASAALAPSSGRSGVLFQGMAGGARRPVPCSWSTGTRTAFGVWSGTRRRTRGRRSGGRWGSSRWSWRPGCRA